MAVASFGSATAREAFFSSLIDSRSLASIGVTFPSVNSATSANATAAWELSVLLAYYTET